MIEPTLLNVSLFFVGIIITFIFGLFPAFENKIFSKKGRWLTWI